jgi:hypothetical protein
MPEASACQCLPETSLMLICIRLVEGGWLSWCNGVYQFCLLATASLCGSTAELLLQWLAEVSLVQARLVDADDCGGGTGGKWAQDAVVAALVCFLVRAGRVRKRNVCCLGKAGGLRKASRTCDQVLIVLKLSACLWWLAGNEWVRSVQLTCLAI